MKPDIEELRRKYMDNPPEGMTSMDIRRMSEEELPDIDYFLNKLTLMTILEKNFLHPLNPKPSICHVHISAGSFPFRKAPHTVFPIKQRKHPAVSEPHR